MSIWCKFLGSYCQMYENEQHYADTGAGYCTGRHPGLGRVMPPCPWYKKVAHSAIKRAKNMLPRWLRLSRLERRAQDIHRLERLEMDQPKGRSVKKRRVGSTEHDFDVTKVA